MIKIKPFRQSPGLCGPASLKVVMDYYGVFVSEKEIAEAAGATKEKGVSLPGLIKAAKHFNFKTFSKKNGSLQDLEKFLSKKIPVIVDWFLEDDGHYSVVVDIGRKNILLSDPSLDGGKRKILRETFLKLWFDFPGEMINRPKDLILRSMLVITPSDAR
jgi:ABC-type bacteriocin/lantibiotic exporter with double-glycine peptidase domain